LRGLGLRCPFESNVGIFSVAMSPSDSITTNRPLADVSPALESRPAGACVICVINGSGVDVAGAWAEEKKALATSMQAAAAHRKARISLNIKTPNE